MTQGGDVRSAKAGWFEVGEDPGLRSSRKVSAFAVKLRLRLRLLSAAELKNARP